MTTPAEPEYGTGAAGGQLLGGNLNQQSIDRNTRALDQLGSRINQLGGANLFNQARTGGSPSAASSGLGFPPMYNPFSTPAGPATPYPPQAPQRGFPGMVAGMMRGRTPQGPYSAVNMTAGGPANYPQAQFPGVVNPFLNQVGAQVQQMGQIPQVGPAAYRTSSGQVITSPGPATPPNVPPGGFTGGIPPRVNNPFSRGRLIGGALGAVAGAAVLFGNGMRDDQIVANAYTSMATTAAPLGANPSSINSLARYQAFGAGGQNLNGIAFNTQDAAAGAAAMGFIGGYVPGMQMGSQGRAVNSAFNAIGLANPGLGSQGSAALAGTMFSQSMAARMQALGYRSLPRMIGGGFNGMGTNVQSLLQGWYGGANSTPQKNLIATLSQGGVGTANLQALGYTPAQIQQLTPVIETYNKLFNAGLNPGQADSLVKRATRGSQSSMLQAQDELASRYGIQKSDLQALKDRSAVRTGNLSDISGGYNAALQESVKLLGEFNQWLNNIMRATHTTGIVGGLGGVGGALGTVAHGGELMGGAALAARLLRGGGGILTGGGGLMEGLGAAGGRIAGAGRGIMGGLGKAGGWLGDLFGMGAAEGGAGAAGAAGAGAGEAGSVALGATGPIALGGLTVAGLVKFLLDHTSSKDKLPPFEYARFGPGVAGYQKVNIGGGTASAGPGSNKTRQGPGKGNKQTVGGSVSGSARGAVNAAESRLGDPYVWGADGPNAFDCSGLVEWAYAQAGVHIPRTSQSQWFGLKDRRISLKNVQEGDIVFGAGSQGSASSPGHEAMMINQRQIIEARGTGYPVAIRAFNPNEWIGAARPRGSIAGQGGPSGGGPGSPGSSSTGLQGNSGMGGLAGAVGFGATEATTLGSTMSESEMLAGGGGAFGGFLGNTGSSNNGSGGSTGGGKGSGGGNISHRGTANLKGNQAIMNKWASKFGWGRGREWNALYTLEMHEAGFNNHAQNPVSTAYGMGQFLDSTWGLPSVHGHKTSDPNLQAEYMMRYIKGRYGDPIHAWAQYYDHPGGVGWYGKGGRMRPGEVGLVGDRGPELIQAGQGGADIMSAAKTAEILSGVNSLSQQVGKIPHGTSRAGTVTLNFAQGSVVIGTNGSYNESANAARVFLRKLKKELEQEHVYMVIAEGEKH